ncbi:ATP-binding cassette domain-containing protein [Flaviflexus sp. JY899]|uniref:ATP-binding cassette domain-containing protein n=2 Tax=Flaviflexus equikiangi TaxID=2758573 RepID=A0ABS2TG40_9ACTO|nr:ATP-binding cassette domain-containing protein [Flaviflexus equikiangi]
MNDMTQDKTDELTERLAALEAGISHGQGHIEPFLLARATDDLQAVKHRMALGTDLTVVALVGGTGSGKSTTFNAITGLEFADSGEIRPTTERAAACSWGESAGPMLDFLGVDEDRRIRKGSLLTDEEPEFRGLVLLDLPDHDSVAVSHSVQVTQLMPLVDLLIWVLDPQKYADQALHGGYLQGLERRKDAMLVVLNHIDTVPFDQRDRIVRDVEAVLAADGLDGVPVVTTSALEHQGIDELKIHIAAAVSKPSINAITATAEISAIAERLRSSVAETEAEVTESRLQPVAGQLARAAGISAVGSSMRAGGDSWRQFALAKPEQPATSTVNAVRDSWLDAIKQDLPPAWAKSIHEAAASPEKLRRDITDAVNSIPVTKPSSLNALMLLFLGIILALCGIGLGVATALGQGVLTQDALNWALAGGLVLVGVWSAIMAKSVRKTASIRAADRYERAVGDKITEVLIRDLGNPVQDVLSKHKMTREALATARG